MLSSALFLALAMECAPTIHPDTAHDVARVESGLNPLAIGVVGQKKGLYPHNMEEAVHHIDLLKAQGKNYSVGLMQINQAHFSRYSITAKQLLKPCANLTVFEKIITDCYLRGGTLKRALSCYYSGNFDRGQKPEAAFSNTSYLERMGYTSGKKYIVPSSHTDQQKPNTIPSNPACKLQIRYPRGIVRGDFITAVALPLSTPATPVTFPSDVMRGEFVVITSE
ncbi:lytic transglycosylase domain-containing protein [Citrobacter sp. JGM124]|uniref:lytic transglycosylase domain-containing protein n=1 Tax=Citrobacter sp. JGM124 TaxID=2799789 RepID=UPI001BA57EA3|nr:lytic transglycosylase domain-containing protein [Citrobacter sp. JGM124]MBS0847044.1 lytic transglycosylase domain-containing protein [Citrobacter sp. JGM124]